MASQWKPQQLICLTANRSYQVARLQLASQFVQLLAAFLVSLPLSPFPGGTGGIPSSELTASSCAGRVKQLVGSQLATQLPGLASSLRQRHATRHSSRSGEPHLSGQQLAARRSSDSSSSESSSSSSSRSSLRRFLYGGKHAKKRANCYI